MPVSEKGRRGSELKSNATGLVKRPAQSTDALAAHKRVGETAAMTPEEEQRALETVIERLAEYFPHTERAELAGVVDEEHHKLDGNPVRDYIAVLVEHASRERLRDEGHEEVLPSETIPAPRHTTSVTADPSRSTSVPASAAYSGEDRPSSRRLM